MNSYKAAPVINHVKLYLYKEMSSSYFSTCHDKIIPSTPPNDLALVGFGVYFLIMDSYSLSHRNDVAFIVHV